MNKNIFRLVFSRCRGMLVAVAETAVAHGRTGDGETRAPCTPVSIMQFAMRHVAFAVLVLAGFAPALSDAQIVPSGANAPNVISTANGLPQVNVNRPSGGGGVSLNTYSQFDVGARGAILNNSPVNTNTQLAGQISGNPNFGPNDAARIIVNQVNSSAASQINGHLEVAGQRAEVVIATDFNQTTGSSINVGGVSQIGVGGNGANSVTVISGGDTNVIGSQINGRQIAADVGGNLNIVSVQDVTNSAAHQSSTGGGFTISQGGGSASFSAQNGHADSNYAGVDEQVGINAGDGGFSINVKGNTDLTGGVISSAADPSQNSLTTGTLTFSDIQNQSHYSANSNGISAGIGVGNTGKATGPGSVSGTPGVSPMISQNENGDESATTRSAVSAGAINITDGAKQTQDLASLSRDTTNTNGTVAKTPDVNAILSQQADTMQAAQAAGQTVSQGIGAYAESKLEAAQKAGDAAGEAAWAEGGDNRALLHALGGALIGGLGGGSAFGAIGGAAGAGLSSKLAGQLESLSKGVASETGSELLGNLAANVAAGVGGVLVGGTAGAATASNVELYNQMLHQKKKDLVSQVCGAGAQCSDATLNAVIGAQGAIAQTASDNMKAQAPYVAGTLALGFLGPDAIISAGTVALLDLTSDAANYMIGLSADKPNIGKSYVTGLVGGIFGPLAIGDESVAAMSKGGILAAGSYNALVNATSVFGTSAATGNSPDLPTGLAAGTTVAGYAAQALVPGPAGVWANKVIQNSAGTVQNVITKK
ncbi:ESPR-type extended signal peptide-containing protein [Paraburkholderia youngii]